MRVLLCACTICGVGACASSVPTASQPGATGAQFDVRFNFPEGSVCLAETSTGKVEQKVIPGEIRLSYSEKNAPISCILPKGDVYQITTPQRIPASSRVSAGITVYPDDRAFITTDVDGSLAQLDLTGQGTVQKQ